MFNYIQKNLFYIKQETIKLVGSTYTFYGFIFFLQPAENILPPELSVLHRIGLGVLYLLITIIVSFAIKVISLYRSNCYLYLKIKDTHYIYVHYGDVFDANIIKNSITKNSDAENGRNIIIPTNCCFDTKVDDVQIAKGSLQGIAINKMIAHGISETEISQRIKQNLISQKIDYETLDKKEKPKGNLNRYPVGTIATINGFDNIRFMFLALVKFDKDLHSIRPSPGNFHLALGRMIKNMSRNSEQYPIILPIIGSGLSNSRLSEQNLLEYILKLLKLHQNEFNCDIHVVVYKDKKKDISITSAI